MSSPREEYQRRVTQWQESIVALERRHFRISNIRLALFGSAGIVAWLAFGPNLLSPAWLLLVGLAFLPLVAYHARVLTALERGIRARQWYERGIDRLDGRWIGVGPDGSRFLEGHAYAKDLDLFGPASLFQLLNTAKTEAGEDTLAGWLRSPADFQEVSERQAAVGELRTHLDFREDLAVLAADTHVGRTAALTQWSAAPSAGLTTAVAWILASSALTAATLVVLAVTGHLGVQWPLAWLAMQGGLMFRWRRQVGLVTGRIDTPGYDLLLLQQLLERLEGELFQSSRLEALHASLVSTGALPSRRIARLRTLISLLDSAHNPYFQLSGLAFVLLIKNQAAVAIDRWHTAHREALGRWLQTVGEFEALSAFGTRAYEHPNDPFPTLVVDGPVFEAEGLAHPLIHEPAAIRNDVHLGGTFPHVLVVSGSNMSGKSTLLRAIGVNVVLAQAGATVRAERLRLSALALGATLRVEDSLAEQRSRFYAEILRIRAIVDVANGSGSLLFLLDEILHGTNSYDRRIGAEAIVHGLVEAGAIGLVTTHDLALTELVSSLGKRAANVHFEDRLEEGRMIFDYRMRPGVVEHSNAIALMRAVGLKV